MSNVLNKPIINENELVRAFQYEQETTGVAEVLISVEVKAIGGDPGPVEERIIFFTKTSHEDCVRQFYRLAWNSWLIVDVTTNQDWDPKQAAIDLRAERRSLGLPGGELLYGTVISDPLGEGQA